MLNMNEAPQQKNFDPIPDGSFVKLLMQFKPGGANMQGADAADAGLFKNSKTSDAVMLECEFTVLEGIYQHKKWSEHWTTAGGSVDEKGASKGWNMTRQRIRAILESCQGIRPDDESDQAKAGRMLPNFKSLNDIWFYAKLRIEEGEDYPDQETGQMKRGFDKNVIDRIVTPDMPEYAIMAAGQVPEPKPAKRRAAPAASGGQADSGPRWGGKPATSAPQPTPQDELPGVGGKDAPATPSASSGPAWLRK